MKKYLTSPIEWCKNMKTTGCHSTIAINFKPFLGLHPLCGLLSLLILSHCATPGMSQSKSEKDQDGFVQIFDGKTLKGWEGDSTYWRVENGNLVGEVTPSTLLERNSFIIWRGGLTSDFELKVEYRVSKDGNSGINYRSEELEDIPYALRGYQADLDGAQRYTGSNYEERGRTTLASRGEKVLLKPVDQNLDSLQAHIKSNHWVPAETMGDLGSMESLQSHIKDEDWNEYHLIVKGNHLRHYVNDVLMSDVIDKDTVNRKFKGLLGVQVHVGPPMKIEYRNFRLKQLK